MIFPPPHRPAPSSRLSSPSPPSTSTFIHDSHEIKSLLNNPSKKPTSKQPLSSSSSLSSHPLTTTTTTTCRDDGQYSVTSNITTDTMTNRLLFYSSSLNDAKQQYHINGYDNHHETTRKKSYVTLTVPFSLPGASTFDIQTTIEEEEEEENGDDDDTDGDGCARSSLRSTSTRTMTVVVAPGGVVKGQRFVIPMEMDDSSSDEDDTNGTNTNRHPKVLISSGFWKDGLFDCCTYGICHEHMWCSICCPLLALAQLMTRLRLDSCAQPHRRRRGRRGSSQHDDGHSASLPSPSNCCHVLLLLTCAFWLILLSLHIDSLVLFLTVTSFTILYGCYIGIATRGYIRRAHAIENNTMIPLSCCGSVEVDSCCVGVWCCCCSVSQMMRHTGEYEINEGVCWSTTGLMRGASYV